jgi:hypothetical protein
MVHGLWLVVVVLVARSTHQRLWRRLLATLAVLLFVFSAFQTQGVLSDDALRYHWDGWIGVHGVDPYANVPEHETLAPYHVEANGIAYPGEVPYADLPTVYPPGAQLLFSDIASVVGVNALGWKLIWCSVLAILLTLIHRQLRDHERRWFWLVMVSPFFLVHAVADLHLDALMACLTALALLKVRGRQFVFGGILLGLAISVKYAPLVAVPFLLLTLSWRQRVLVLGAMIVTIGLVFAPYVNSQIWGDLQNFLTNWKANAAVYDVARMLLPDRTQTRIALSLVVLVISFIIWRRWKHQPETLVALAMMIFLISSPVIHAWYLLSVVMLLPMAPLRSTIVWMATVGIYAVFVEIYRTTGTWEEPPVLLALEALPVIAAYVIDVRRGPITAS